MLYMKESLAQALRTALLSMGAEATVVIERPAELSHGDYATGVALQYAKKLALSPRALAEQIVAQLGTLAGVEKIEIAGAGFINFFLSPDSIRSQVVLAQNDTWGSGQSRAGTQEVFEYTDPNPFKAFHIGHLMSNTIGESLSRLAQNRGATVVRANYQGDVGVHVACAL